MGLISSVIVIVVIVIVIVAHQVFIQMPFFVTGNSTLRSYSYDGACYADLAPFVGQCLRCIQLGQFFIVHDNNI